MEIKDGIGFGHQVPPIKEHVLIWFLYHGAEQTVGRAFFYSYAKSDWKNKKGVIIKNWKVHAWKWLWERSRGGH